MTIGIRWWAAGGAVVIAAIIVYFFWGGEKNSGPTISVISATYGQNCGAPVGNATDALRKACDRRSICNYIVDVNVLGDAAGGCDKDFEVNYQCSGASTPIKKELPPATGNKEKLQLTCAK